MSNVDFDIRVAVGKDMQQKREIRILRFHGH